MDISNNSKASSLEARIRSKIDQKTKPLGALGQLEEVALQIAMIQQTETPKISSPHIIVFAADHGIAATGLVNPYPQAVTAQMVLNFLRGGAAINVFCRLNQITLTVVDAGVNYHFDASEQGPDFIDAKIAMGTRSYLEHPAMSAAEFQTAIRKGGDIVQSVHVQGSNCVGFGEMGIGNSSAASLIMSAVTGIALKDCVGRGTGADDSQLALKIKTLEEVYRLHRPAMGAVPTAEKIMQHFGGFELAMMTGAYLRAASLGMIIVVDGFISTAALLIANLIEPGVREHCLFAHCSGEKGHEQMLSHLDAKPLLRLNMRLGEGSAAALAIPLLRSSVCFLNEMSSFEQAGVSNKD